MFDGDAAMCMAPKNEIFMQNFAMSATPGTCINLKFVLLIILTIHITELTEVFLMTY